MRASASELARYREQLEEHQALAAQWERRAESAAAAAAASDKARASLLNEKAQLEERLAAGLSMSEELGNRLRQIEAELRQQISDATAREAALKAEAEEQKDAHQRTIAGLLARIEDLDKQRDRDTVSREAALRHAVQTQDGLKARIEQLERELSAVQIESRSAHEQLGDAASSHRRDLEASEALVAESRQALADSQAGARGRAERPRKGDRSRRGPSPDSRRGSRAGPRDAARSDAGG